MSSTMARQGVYRSWVVPASRGRASTWETHGSEAQKAVQETSEKKRAGNHDTSGRNLTPLHRLHT